MAYYEPTYITAIEVKANTNNAGLSGQTDEFINKLIVEAQFIVDANIGDIVPFEEGQDFKFPNADEIIPKDIKQATQYIVESLYENKGKEALKGEAWDGYSVKYDESGKGFISSSAEDILKKYSTGGKSGTKITY